MLKEHKIITINGVKVEEANVREGTRCKCCNKKIHGIIGESFFQTHTSTCQVAYVCRDCVKMHGYGYDIPEERILKNKATKGKYRFSVEIEANFKEGKFDTNAKLIHYLAAQWGLIPTADCTVDVEFKMLNVLSFHGLKDFFEDISKRVELNATNCGHHINLSKTTWTANNIDSIRLHGIELFNPLMEYLRNHKNDTIKVFGRYFGTWAQDDKYYQHGSWLNLGHTYRIEFRLPHFVNTNQFFYCCNYCRDVVDILDKWLEGEIDTEKASNKMIKTFQKYADGKATCQRAERNAIER